MPPLSFESHVHGARFPAMPQAEGAALLAVLFQLEHSQWWPPEEIRRRQGEQLAALVAHARRTVPFYRAREGWLPPDEAIDLDGEAWLRVPVLRRSDVQEAGDDLLSAEPPAAHGRLSEIHTSGTTGRPLRAVRTQLWGLYWSAFTLRDHLWHGRDLAGKLAAIRESGKGKALYPDGKRAASWGRSSGRVFRTGPSVGLNVATPTDRQVEWLAREDPDYLLTHPSIVARLAAHCLERDVRLPRLRQVETLSELVQPAARELCRAAWGVPLVDMYSAREAGYLALQCPGHEHYHVQSEGVLLEVLDEAGRPCAPGDVGRVVVTPLHNFAMPLVRYEIGDWAEVGPACPCGRGLPVLARILGRRQNMLVMPGDGERWPLLSSRDIARMTALAPIRQYQFVQRQPELIELRLVTARELTAGEEDALRAWVREKFGHPFEVALSYHDDIPRSAAGKFDDFVSEVHPSGAPD